MFKSPGGGGSITARIPSGGSDSFRKTTCEEDAAHARPAAQHRRLWVIEARLGIEHGPCVFYNPMTGDNFKD
jgi:hypothetical protein